MQLVSGELELCEGVVPPRKFHHRANSENELLAVFKTVEELRIKFLKKFPLIIFNDIIYLVYQLAAN